jgi:hypothetical protein
MSAGKEDLLCKQNVLFVCVVLSWVEIYLPAYLDTARLGGQQKMTVNVDEILIRSECWCVTKFELAT